ncbi:Golgi transport complex subunit 4 [Coniothyrium glycines]
MLPSLLTFGTLLLPLVSAQCPLYTHYASQRHEPFTEGRYKLSYARPIPSCRAFPSPEVEGAIERLRHVITDAELFRIFENSWPNTLDTTIAWRGPSNVMNGLPNAPESEELTFVITGDIEAIHNSIASLFRGAINLQARYILESPFCNAFQAPDESGIPHRSSMNSDRITPSFDYYKVFSCQWELDSLASFLQLSVDYVTATKDFEFFQRSSNWTKAVDAILKTTQSMMIDSYSEDGQWQHTPYTYCAPYGGTPINDCNGSPHRGNIGLVRSFQRPSDDSCTYQYLIPSNMMFSVTLNASSAIMERIEGPEGNLTLQMKSMSTGINQGIEKYGVVTDPKYGKIYAYEVDGYGGVNIMDDPNIPSLLSAPFLKYTTAQDHIYQNTRSKILSRDNPYYAWGPIITGVGSPHTKPGAAWPMALIMTILTSDNDAEIIQNLKMLLQSTDGFGVMHESQNSRDAKGWSRQWFAWANGLFGQAILDLEVRKPHILAMSFQGP